MKKLFLFLAVLISIQAVAQTIPTQTIPGSTVSNRLRVRNILKIDSVLRLPGLVYSLNKLDPGDVAYQTSDSSLYTWTGYQWLRQFSGSGGGSGTVTSSATTGYIPYMGTNTNLVNSPISYSGGISVSAGLVNYYQNYSNLYTDRSLIDKKYADSSISAAVSGISAGGTSDLVNTTMAALDGSTGFNTTKTYFVTDAYRQGLYRYVGIAADQALDNGGIRIVTADLKAYDRVSFDGKINVMWFTTGTFVPASIANSSIDTAVGTDIAPAINAAMKAANSGQTIVIPMVGNIGVVMHSNIDSLKNKQYIFQLDAILHTNKRRGFLLYPPDVPGADKSHIVRGNGAMVGVENLAGHTKTTHDNGTQPVWSNITWNAFEIGNCSKNTIEIHKVTGFNSLVQWKNGGGLGSQENSISCQWVDRCSNGVVITFYGNGFCDKNIVTGINGGPIRIDAGLALKIEDITGNSTGSAQWDIFRNWIVERVDSIASCQTNVTEMLWDSWRFESGINTGVFGDQYTAIQLKKSGADLTYVRNMTIANSAFIYIDLLTGGIGRGGAIVNTAMYVRDLPASINAVKIGNNAICDDIGNLLVTDAPPALSTANRNRAPAIFLFKQSSKFIDADSTITSSAFTLVPAIKWLEVNNASGSTVTLPSAATNAKKDFYIFNVSASGTVAVSGLLSGQDNSIPPGKAMYIHGDGGAWNSQVSGGGSSGTSQWNNVGNGINYPASTTAKVGIGQTSPTAFLHLRAGIGGTTANSAPLKIPQGSLLTNPEDGAIEFFGNSPYWTYGSTRVKILTEDNVANVYGKTFPGLPTLYSGDGVINSTRTIAQNANVNYVGSFDLAQYGGTFRVGSSTLPTTSDVATAITGNTIRAQLFGGGVWNNSSTLHLDGAVALDDQSGTGTRMATVDAAGNIGNRPINYVSGTATPSASTNYTVTVSDQFIVLPTVTTNRNIVFPNPSTMVGRIFYVICDAPSSSSFGWSIKDASGNNLFMTWPTNSTTASFTGSKGYILICDGTNLRVVSMWTNPNG